MSKFFELFAKNARSIIAVSVVWLAFAFLFMLLFVPIPKENETVLNVATGLVLAALGGVIAYYFGSSKDKSDVDKADSEIEKQEAGIRPPTITPSS
jgi:uncharacterized protein YhhL (DUF1145 family)